MHQNLEHLEVFLMHRIDDGDGCLLPCRHQAADRSLGASGHRRGCAALIRPIQRRGEALCPEWHYRDIRHVLPGTASNCTLQLPRQLTNVAALNRSDQAAMDAVISAKLVGILRIKLLIPV